MTVETYNESNPYGSASTIIEGTPLNPDTTNDPAPGAPAPVVKGTDTKFVSAPLETPPAADPAADAADANAAAAQAALLAAAAAAGTPVAPAPAVDGQTPAPDAPVDGSVPALPAGGVEKFHNKQTGVYNWEAHARETEFRLAQKGKGTRQPAPAAKGAPIAPAQQAVSDAGLNWETLGETLLAKGELQESDYTALDAAGIPREIVDNYVGALASVGTLAREAAEVYIGGGRDLATNKAAAQELMDWAAQNLTETETAEHNRILETSNWRISVDALLTARGAAPGVANAEPRPATVLRGANAVNPLTNEGAFSNFAEQMDAQSDPRYAKDEKYRQSVIRRIALGG